MFPEEKEQTIPKRAEDRYRPTGLIHKRLVTMLTYIIIIIIIIINIFPLRKAI